jgi:hypothetical protein
MEDFYGPLKQACRDEFVHTFKTRSCRAVPSARPLNTPWERYFVRLSRVGDLAIYYIINSMAHRVRSQSQPSVAIVIAQR